MKYLFLLFSFFFSWDHPKVNEWVCFVNDVKDQSCGSIGYSLNKKVAIGKAFDLCQDECGNECKLEYCYKNEKTN